MDTLQAADQIKLQAQFIAQRTSGDAQVVRFDRTTTWLAADAFGAGISQQQIANAAAGFERDLTSSEFAALSSRPACPGVGCRTYFVQ